MASLSLDRKERTGLLIGGVAAFLVLCMLAYVPLGPRARYIESGQELGRLDSQRNLLLLAKMDEEDRLSQQETMREWLEARPRTFDLLAFLSRSLNEAGLSGRYELQSGRAPAGAGGGDAQNLVTAQLRLSGVTLKELLDFLHKVYANQNVIVLYRLDWLRTTPNNQGLDLNVTFLTVRT